MSKSINEVIQFSHFLKRGKPDRLSDLPDCVLLHILSYLDSKYAVQTCILSTRWKNLWKRIPTLILNYVFFHNVKKFAIFVSKILTLRDTSTALHALNLRRHGVIEPQLLKKILKYVSSHNNHLKELMIYVHGDSNLIMSCVSSCRTLTSVKLSLLPKGPNDYTEALFPKSLNLPLLTSLDLTNFTFCRGENDCAEPFSALTKLNSLVICNCKLKDAQILNISSEILVNLTLDRNSSNLPQIKLSTPSLSTFTFTGIPIQKICGSGLSSVKRANINAAIDGASVEYALVLLSWLQNLASLKSLRVSSTTLQVLSLVPGLLEVIKFPSLCNLKSLEVELIPLFGESLKAAAKSLKEEAGGIVDFLRQNSPLAEVNVTKKLPGFFNLKQVEEWVKGGMNMEFAAPASSSAIPDFAAATAAAPASSAPPSLHFCRAEKMTTNVDSNDSTLWPDFVTKVFIDIMVDEVTKGNMPNGVFHTGTWTSMTTRLNSITNCSYKKEQLEAKMYRLRAMFLEFYSLLQNSGFGWNAETNSGFDIKLLEIIFNKNNETDVLHHSYIQDQPNTDIEIELDNQYLNTGNNAHVDNDSSDNDIQEMDITHSGKQKIQVKDHTSSKESASNQMGDALVAQARSQDKIVESSSSHVTGDCSLTKCVVALEEIRDISDDIYGKALEKFKDPDWREMFIAMSNDRRREWLFRL